MPPSRSTLLRYLLLATFLVGTSLASQEQEKSVTVVLLNGKTGKPIKDTRLLFFVGNSPEQVRFHEAGSLDARTDAEGKLILPVDPSTVEFLQAFPDFLTLCQQTPNYRSFSVEAILRRGVSSPNNCGGASSPDVPGTLVVYARRSTLKEQMTR